MGLKDDEKTKEETDKAILVSPVKSSEDCQKNKKEDDNEDNDPSSRENKKKEDVTTLLSDEDEKLKADLEKAVHQMMENNVNSNSCTNTTTTLRENLTYLRTEIRSATSSMTSVPKPLKFLRVFYDELKTIHETLKDETDGKDLADVISVLAMTMATEGSRESLGYKLRGNVTDLGSWGHEFVRSLCGEIGQEYVARTTSTRTTTESLENKTDDLLSLVADIVPFHIKHNAESEAVDILLEVSQLSTLLQSPDIDASNYQRICIYLLACADYMSDPEDLVTLLSTAFELYKRMKQFPDALRVALRAINCHGSDNTTAWIDSLFDECKADMTTLNQMAFILGRHKSGYVYEAHDDVNELIGNNTLTADFVSLARDLDVMDVKTPEDIYKSHLSETRSSQTSRRNNKMEVDSARHNLASTFVNAFVNAGYGKDSLMTPEESSWLYKNKEHGMLSASASLGMIFAWNVEEGLTQLDKFLYSGEEYIKAGASLAIGLVCSGVRNECDPALALLTDQITSTNVEMKLAACASLGLAYAGTNREDVVELLSPIVCNTETKSSNLMPEVSIAALSVGMIYVGSCDEDMSSEILQRLMEATNVELSHPFSIFLSLALGLLFFGAQEKASAMLEALKTIDGHYMGKVSEIVLETCAYAGTGDVLQVQKLLQLCAEHLTGESTEEESEEGSTTEAVVKPPVNTLHQSVAVLGIGLVTMGEGIGTEMAIRAFDHLLQYGELPVRRAVPLGLSLLHLSNPEYAIVDTLSRLTHDTDMQVAAGATLGLGLISAGTNNSRVAGLLRQLSDFYSREANNLFMVRIAQGLLHMGKGLITIHPFHSDRLLLSGVSMTGILTVLFASIDLKSTLLDKSHYLLYYLVTAMHPRMLITVNEDLEALPVTVRVGQAVEVVGQAGKPKSITGFQTHTTPVLLNVNERAQLATEEYLPISNVLEGVVILRKNPDYEPDA